MTCSSALASLPKSTYNLGVFQPCSPMTAKSVPPGAEWLHEVKFDGYRVQAHKVGSRVVVYSRNGHAITERFPSVVWAVLSAARLGIGDTWVWALMSAA
jgi:ATP-dependent DNA ligase